MTNEYIRHQGIVQRIDNQRVYVRIEQKAACKDCHAGAVCLAADKKEKMIEVSDYTGDFAVQEQVIISVRQSMGWVAIVVAYVIPLVLVIFFVVAGIYVSGSEAGGGLAGLLVLLPYYFFLYLLRDKINKRFDFTLLKAPESSVTVTN